MSNTCHMLSNNFHMLFKDYATMICCVRNLICCVKLDNLWIAMYFPDEPPLTLSRIVSMFQVETACNYCSSHDGSHLDELAHPPAGHARPTTYWWQMELYHAPSTCASHISLAPRIVAPCWLGCTLAWWMGGGGQLQGGVSCPVKQNTPPLGHQYYTGVGRLGSQRSNFIRPRS